MVGCTRGLGCAVILLLRRSLSAALRAVHRATERRRALSRREIPVVLVRRVAMRDAGFWLEARVLAGGGAGVVVASPKFHSTAPLRGGCRAVHRAWHVRGLRRRGFLQARARATRRIGTRQGGWIQRGRFSFQRGFSLLNPLSENVTVEVNVVAHGDSGAPDLNGPLHGFEDG